YVAITCTTRNALHSSEYGSSVKGAVRIHCLSKALARVPFDRREMEIDGLVVGGERNTCWAGLSLDYTVAA
ncbi:hypothetical protein WUBG_12151, partial [Wuchereria bancrofti]